MTTILGQHSISDLKWLVDSRDYFYGRLSGAIGRFYGQWAAKDPDALRAWYADYQAFELRYAVAREKAEAAIEMAKFAPLTPDANINADPEWTGIVRAFQKIDKTRSPGDFADLVARLHAAGEDVTFPEIPPDTTIDLDGAVYKTADDVLKAIEHGAAKVGELGSTAMPFAAALFLLGGGLLLAAVAGKVRK